MSNGVSKRKACQFVGITRRGLDLPLKDKGDERMKESIVDLHPLIRTIFILTFRP